MNDQLKMMNENNIKDGLLREFIIKELWSAAIKSCDDAMEKRKGEVELLEELKRSMINESMIDGQCRQENSEENFLSTNGEK